MRMRVLVEKLRVENENESFEGKMRLKLRMRLSIIKNEGLIYDSSY